MRTIYKYNLLPERTQKIELPAGARVLSAGAQGEDIVIWAMVDLDTKEKEIRSLVVLGTGHQFEGDTAHYLHLINTVQMPDGLVFHVFEDTGLVWC